MTENAWVRKTVSNSKCGTSELESCNAVLSDEANGTFNYGIYWKGSLRESITAQMSFVDVSENNYTGSNNQIMKEEENEERFSAKGIS